MQKCHLGQNNILERRESVMLLHNPQENVYARLITKQLNSFKMQERSLKDYILKMLSCNLQCASSAELKCLAYGIY